MWIRAFKTSPSSSSLNSPPAKLRRRDRDFRSGGVSPLRFHDPRGLTRRLVLMRIRWRGLEMPNRLICDRNTLTDTYGKFFAEPFERGFGVTVGNSLRRILLSSLEGSSVIRVKIQGVHHEISTIPGVVEDVTDIILNIKSLVVKNSSDQSKVLRIDRHERGVVKAAHITADESVQIINGAHILATLTDDVPFHVEMTA